MKPSTNASNFLMSAKASYLANGAMIALLAIIALGIAQEMWLAPLRPGGSWLVLKIVPLLFSLRGVIKRDNYTLQWSSMLILLYFTEGIVRANSDTLTLSAQLGWLQVLLCSVFFYCTLSYLKPIKKAAKAAAKIKTDQEKEAAITSSNSDSNAA